MMFRNIALAAIALTAGLIPTSSALAQVTPSAGPQLVVLGAPHFSNHNRDTANVATPDVMTPERQAEIERLVEALAGWRPTHVAVEWAARDQAGLDRRYADYRAGRYVLSENEIDQIGLRLAARLGLDRIEAVDANDDPPGPPDIYDYPAWAETHGRMAKLQAVRQVWIDAAADYSRQNRCHAVADWIRAGSGAAMAGRIDPPYYDLIRFGDATANPGAAWLAHWQHRNLRIVANLAAAASGPEDRMVTIFGFGHISMIRDYAEKARLFQVVEAAAVLPPPRPSQCPEE